MNTSNENSVQKKVPLKTHSLDLIRLGFAIEEEKIGATMPILAPLPNRDKPEIVRSGGRRGAAEHLPNGEGTSRC
jgi:hypothetical protein